MRKFRCCDAAKRCMHSVGNGRLTRGRSCPRNGHEAPGGAVNIREYTDLAQEMPFWTFRDIWCAHLSARARASVLTQVTHARFACDSIRKNEHIFTQVETHYSDVMKIGTCAYGSAPGARSRNSRDEFTATSRHAQARVMSQNPAISLVCARTRRKVTS